MDARPKRGLRIAACLSAECVAPLGGGYLLPRVRTGVNLADPPTAAKKGFCGLHNVWGARASRCSDDLSRALDHYKPQTVGAIKQFIKQARLRSFKRYDCIAMFSKNYLTRHPIALTANQIKVAQSYFNRVERHHRGSVAFFRLTVG